MENDYDHFLIALNKWGDAPWLNQYFDLLQRMYNNLGINAASLQLGMTVGKNYDLNVNIGQRWVCCPWGDEKVGLILPLSADEASYNCELDAYFKRNNNPEAKWVIYKWRAGSSFPEPLYHQWEQACADEMKRTRKSSYRKFHSDLFFDAVMRSDLRKQIFADAYKSKG